jgi:glucans biosynthesis protein
MILSRRRLMGAAAALAAAALAPAARGAQASGFSPHSTGAPQPFDYGRLKGLARERAAQPFEAPTRSLPPAVAALDYDGFQSIRFVRREALWAGTGRRFAIRFFHRGYRYLEKVRMHEVVDGTAREIEYDAAMFDLRKTKLAGERLPDDLGFAGFRVNFHTDWDSDVAAFLGASYFRAIGVDRQYGISARGLAIGVGRPSGEEFPEFTDYWFERPAADADAVNVYALLDSPSVAGAYRFTIAPGASTAMDIDVALYPRTAIDDLGIAPLTSMFMTGENDRRVGSDWRPEIHDSDGLAIANGDGEWIWRPLVNAPGTRLNSFADRDPRGFGLLQRDRDFDHYQDDGAFYDRRPSAWVTPKPGGSGFGEGAVRLLEYPAGNETIDNIVACWHPGAPAQPGQERLYAYRLDFGVRAPMQSPLATVVATYTGIGGVVGLPRRYFSWRFVVDFVGGVLATLPREASVEPVITASRGDVEITSARPQHAIAGYRAMFDLKPADDSVEPIDLRLFLRLDGGALTETWLYQWTPPSPETRRALLAG